MFYRAHAKTKLRLAVRDARRDFLRPLFNDRYAEFFVGLGVPLKEGTTMNKADADRIGRNIMLYLADNPSEAQAFLNCCHEVGNPIDAAECETMSDHMEVVRIMSFRALTNIVAMHNGPSYNAVDLDHVRVMLEAVERDPRAFFVIGPSQNSSAKLTWDDQ